MWWEDSQHPSPTATAKSVSTNPLPLAGITPAIALYKSYPAANALPRVGVFAFSDNFFTNSGGEDERGGGGALDCAVSGLALPLETAGLVEEAIEADCSVLGRLARGEVGREGGRWVCEGGLVDIVIIGEVQVRDAMGRVLIRNALFLTDSALGSHNRHGILSLLQIWHYMLSHSKSQVLRSTQIKNPDIEAFPPPDQPKPAPTSTHQSPLPYNRTCPPQFSTGR